jgi:hypothetical protein
MLGYHEGLENGEAVAVVRESVPVTIETIKAENLLAGRHFFDKRTISFFKSKVLPTVYGGKYFITSEVDPAGVKRYTVREALNGGKLIRHVGDFHAYTTKKQAVRAIRELLA